MFYPIILATTEDLVELESFCKFFTLISDIFEASKTVYLAIFALCNTARILDDRLRLLILLR